MKKIGIIVGSLRKESFSRKVAAALGGGMGDGYELLPLDIDLPMYNQDLDDAPPAAWESFRAAAASCDAFMFITPEYNRSFPAIIKNALDIGSRPYGQNLWAGKKALVVGVSPGALGGCLSVNHLRQTMAFVDLRVMQQPEGYIGNIAGSLDADGKPTEKLAGFLKTIAESYKKWLD